MKCQAKNCNNKWNIELKLKATPHAHHFGSLSKMNIEKLYEWSEYYCSNCFNQMELPPKE